MPEASWPLAQRGADSDIEFYGPGDEAIDQFGPLGPYECRGCVRKVYIQMNVHQAYDHLVEVHRYMGEKVPDATVHLVTHLREMQARRDIAHKAERS